MRINELAKAQYEWVESVGWHNKTNIEYCGLIMSEGAEAMAECRGLTPTPKLAEELADVILRTVDFAEVHGIDLEEAIRAKMLVNAERGTRGRHK